MVDYVSPGRHPCLQIQSQRHRGPSRVYIWSYCTRSSIAHNAYAVSGSHWVYFISHLYLCELYQQSEMENAGMG
jgi:hypothetical protein